MEIGGPVVIEIERAFAQVWATMGQPKPDDEFARLSPPPGEPRHPVAMVTSGAGSVGRAAAGAIRIGNAVGAAFTSRRVLEPVEAQILFTSGALLVILSVLSAFRPQVPAYALMVLLSWIGLALLYRGYRLYREGKRSK